MKKTKNMLLSMGLSFAMIATFVCSVPAVAAETNEETLVTTAAKEAEKVTTGVTEVQSYGHLNLEITYEDFTKAGYALGDIVSVVLNGKTYEMPFATSYNAVDRGAPLLRYDKGRNLMVLAINYGKIIEDAGIADYIDANKDKTDGSMWAYNHNVKSLDEVTVEITMKEKEGFLEQFRISDLESKRTNNREDYTSDAEFANFRNVKVGEIGEGAFFRGSSPVNNEIKRAAYADKFLKEAGVQAVMNLADSDEKIKGFFEGEDFDSPYYKSLFEDNKVIALNLAVDYMSEGWAKTLVNGFKFFAENEGPYYVHCLEGKDRAGITSMLIEAVMGATYEEIVKDYVQTYINYYFLDTKDKEVYETLVEKTINGMIRDIAGAEKGADVTKIDIKAAAEKYLTDAGLTADELAKLKENLSKDYKEAAPAPAAELTDIADSWAKDDITSLVALGYVTGYPDKTFRPQNPISRAECMSIINKALKLTEESDKVADFVDAEGWFKADIAKALAKGYIKGIDETHIGPDNNITREEVFAIVKRIAALPDGAAADIKAFGDASSVSGWAVPEVAAVVKAGIVTGDGGNLRPTDPLTRAEAARLISNILKVLATLQAAPQ